MTVRPARSDDVQAVLALERGIPTAPHWPLAAYESALRSPSPSRCFFVAQATALAGFAVGSLVAGEAELETVVVAADERRQGFGRALVKAILAWCEAGGATVVRLEVRVSSTGAIRFYESLGFMRLETRAKYYENPVEDAMAMVCRLPSLPPIHV